jgi:hypothetical protein
MPPEWTISVELFDIAGSPKEFVVLCVVMLMGPSSPGPSVLEMVV